ncbi:CRP-like cAMP-binding protein [Paucimonas lemoignei]|uniref:CRP-like cAMP-binding protein n=1 Tax=Paucimonas lemoignei TaxID=29443 RepID=A0A4R3HXU8_PAULE|nr:Crp/Fnr family transcriptional regulator [Paucimonas lemoignei]TCS38012.1 CRP-like cAMP-binding protein [Paucimonas lemoignei]
MTLSDIPWYWRQDDLFEGVQEARGPFLVSAERLEFRRGQMIFSADSAASHVYYLERGTVKVFQISPRGDVTIFWFCSAGDLFGAGGISGAAQQSVFAQATERSVVYALPRSVFESYLRSYPQLGINVIRLLSGRLRLACDAATDNATRRADARLARTLLRLGQQWGQISGEQVRFGAPITHQELANMTGTSRQTVNRLLGEFNRAGWLEFDGRKLVLLRPQALADFANSEEE